MIFISYRRADTAGHAGRVFDHLRQELGEGQIFRDVQSITAGSNYLKTIEAAIRGAEHVLVLIGPDWLSPADGGAVRLFAQDDVVRAEVRLALQLQKRVIPVLAGGAHMPAPAQLPEDLRDFTLCNALELSETRWDYDMSRLIAAMGYKPRSAGRKKTPWCAVGGLILVAAAVALDTASDYGLRPGARAFFGCAAAALGLADLAVRRTKPLRWPALAWLCLVFGLSLLVLGLKKHGVQ